jgi:hypothetical protein
MNETIPIIIATIIAILGASQQIAAASIGFADDDFICVKDQRPAVNPDFAPDEDGDLIHFN